ncbi:ion channel [Yoonia sp. GPGPB17]|uniref:potassium channel family protein n=1 Tax=Yoonia sp. GPGPB17 TaxID=3026147 RepID=UPI0030BE0D5B
MWEWTKPIKAKIQAAWHTTLGFLRMTVLGLHGSSTPGSDQRRMYMRLSMYLGVGYVLWAVFFGRNASTDYSIGFSIAAVTLITASLLVFFQTVLLMPFRDDGSEFKLDVWRLLLDTMISSLFMIVAFSVLYRNIGLVHDSANIKPSALDAIYFSSVTFSTLGYGDFAPQPSIRIIAAAQALLGNLHLGMIVGATFAAIRR